MLLFHITTAVVDVSFIDAGTATPALAIAMVIWLADSIFKIY